MITLVAWSPFAEASIHLKNSDLRSRWVIGASCWWYFYDSRGILGASRVALVVKNLPANAGDRTSAGSIPGSGRSPERGHGNPLQYSCHENPIDRGAWWARVHGVAKSQTPLKWVSMSIRRLLQADKETNHTYTYDWDLRPLVKKKREREKICDLCHGFISYINTNARRALLWVEMYPLIGVEVLNFICK